MRRALLLAVLLGTATASADDWVTVTAGDFEVFTNAGAERATQAAVALERMRAALAVASELETTLDAPIRVYVFKTREDYLRYAALIAGRPPGKDGMSIVHPNAKAIMLDGSAIRSDELLQHELAHHFVRQTHGVLPLWLDEGLAEYYGATRVISGMVQIGRQRPRNRRIFRAEKQVPLRDLLAADEKSRWYANPALESRFYAQAWLLAHWLMLTRHDAIEPLLAELARGDVDAALQKVLRMTPAQLQRELVRYNGRPSLPSHTVKIGDLQTAQPSAPRILDASEQESLFAWTAPAPSLLVPKQLVIVDRDKPEDLARYDEAVKKVARGDLAGAIDILDALIPVLPAGELLSDAKELRAEVAEIMRKNGGGPR